MTANTKISNFLLDQDIFKGCSGSEKLQRIVDLFDNNNEGILRQKEIHQILVCLFVIRSKKTDDEIIKHFLKKTMVNSSGNDYNAISKEEFVRIATKDADLSKILQ